MSGSKKENKRQLDETRKTSGKKSNQVRIEEVGIKLVESGQYPTIMEALGIETYFHRVSNEHYNLEYFRA